MEPLGFITGLVGLIALICVFFMAAALRNISQYLKNINRIANAYSIETGIGLVTKCKKCNKLFTGKPATCPHCGDPKKSD